MLTSLMIFDPDVAAEIGLHEAIVLYQIHRWLESPAYRIIDGRRWIPSVSYEWADKFPFWTPTDLDAILFNLTRTGLLMKMDGGDADWYRIDYDEIEKRMEEA